MSTVYCTVNSVNCACLLSIGDRTAWILPFTSGGFIYIALVTVVPDLLQDSRCPW